MRVWVFTCGASDSSTDDDVVDGDVNQFHKEPDEAHNQKSNHSRFCDLNKLCTSLSHPPRVKPQAHKRVRTHDKAKKKNTRGKKIQSALILRTFGVGLCTFVHEVIAVLGELCRRRVHIVNEVHAVVGLLSPKLLNLTRPNAQTDL